MLLSGQGVGSRRRLAHGVLKASLGCWDGIGRLDPQEANSAWCGGSRFRFHTLIDRWLALQPIFYEGSLTGCYTRAVVDRFS